MTPIPDSFAIRAYWGSYAEPLRQIVQKTTQTLTALRDIDSHFLKYYTGISRKVAFPHKVLLDEESVRG
jgi:hypothetical protein